MKILFLLYFIIGITACNIKAQISGCTDPLAKNYNSSATINDGSCRYHKASVSPTIGCELDKRILETSGLILWNNRIWTHNDNDDINIYALDTINGKITQTIPLAGVINKDWEEISQDEHYLYIGDFGNNASGNRTDLKILRIDKNTILSGTPVIDTIHFTYSNQTDYSRAKPNKTDFDCEAFMVSTDSIYLFTKQWTNKQTSVYSLPKTPGTCIANLKSAYPVSGLITGAVYLEPERIVALCGYSKTLKPFIYLLYDFHDHHFFSGNKRKIKIRKHFKQVEGICTNDGLKYYISNEKLVRRPIVNKEQKIQIVDLRKFLSSYINRLKSSTYKN